MSRADFLSLVRRTARRGLVWFLIISLAVLADGIYVKPAEHAYFWLISFFTACLTILTYELYAHWLFPRYLFHGRWVWFLGLSLVVFALVFGLMYSLYPLIQQKARIPEQLLTILTYPRLNQWYTVHKSGILGWLHTPRTIAIVLGTPYFLASPFLFIQLVRYYLTQRQHGQQTELDNLQISHENTLLELDLLKAQLNPHFLFNSLNSIYVRVIDVNEQAADLVLRLAELMRYNLYEADAPVVALEQELDYIENYLQLEHARQGQRVEILFSNEVSASGLVIAPMILLTFVENAFKYSIGGTQQGAYVWVEAHLDQADTLVFTVQNSLTSGYNRYAADHKLAGVDLPNVRQRLGLLYQDAHRIETEQSDESYSVSLFIRLASAA